MLTFNLRPILKARGVDKPYSYLVKAGFTAHTTNNLLKGTPATIKVAYLEKLCTILICDLNDLFVFTPNKDRFYPPDHPLFELKPLEAPGEWKATLNNMPLKKLREATSKL